jgi:glutamyl-tRNA synthetase
LLDSADFEARIIPYLQSSGVVGAELTEREREVLRIAAPLIQE